MISTLLICGILACGQFQTPNVVSLEKAVELYNGKFVPDSVLLHHIELVSFIGILKLTEDSSKTTIVKGIDKNDLKFVMGTEHLSNSQVAKKILSSNNRSIYIFYCLDMLKTFKNYEIINGSTSDEVANYFGIKDLKEYQELKLF